METYDKLQNPTPGRKPHVRVGMKKDHKVRPTKEKVRRDEREESAYSKLNIPTPPSAGNQKNSKSSKKKIVSQKNVSTHARDHNRQSKNLPTPSTLTTTAHKTKKQPGKSYLNAGRAMGERFEGFHIDLLPNKQTGFEESGILSKSMHKKWTKLVRRSSQLEPSNITKYQDTNQIAKSLRLIGLESECHQFKRIIQRRFQLEEEFVRLNDQVGIHTLEGDYDERALSNHSSVGGLKILNIPKSFIMVDEYDPNILLKNMNVLTDLEKKTIAVHRRRLHEQTR